VRSSSAGSVSQWVDQLRAGDQTAARKLWECYFQRLVALARSKLRGVDRRAADEEDVALSAFESFCRGAEQGRFPDLTDRNNLWRLLVVITARKAYDLVERQHRRKHGGGAVLDEAGLGGPAGLEQVVGRDPTPEFAALVAEECRRLMDRLGSRELRAVALWKMEGYSVDEIAAKLGCAPRTVDRKLWVIRGLWAQEVSS
jgi:DNA-directed RNA polymerase specialized sigma24 family protein